MMRRFLPPLATAAFLLTAGVFAAEVNALSDTEKAAGWKLLFDGKTLDGWQRIGKPGEAIKGWVVQNGVIFCGKGVGGGDIVTEEHYRDFELSWEWRIGEAANSGVKYNLPEAKKGVGFEYQLVDDEKHPDGIRGGKLHTTASLYDLIEPAAERKVKPVGEWNESRIVVKGERVEQWLNGMKTVAFDFGSEDLRARIAKSKYKDVAQFGVKTTSPILLQEHGDEVAFRSIKLRVLDAK